LITQSRRRAGSCSTPRPISTSTFTAADALEELRARLADRGVIFATTHLRSELRAALSRTGWVDRVGADHLFATLPTAVAAYEQWLGDHPATTPADDQPPLV
jgi:SulP family sulfate permease